MSTRAPVTGRAAWRGAELAKRPEEWTYRLSPADVDELDAALAATCRRGLALAEIRREDVPLPTLGPVLADILHELVHGRGFALIRGIPVGRYTLAEAAAIYWGLGTHIGGARPQNARGDLLGHVKDVGRDVDDPHARVYQTNKRQNYHTDSVDIVGLLCWRKARAGGRSSIVSSVTVYNELLRRRPDVIETLSEPFSTDRRGEVPVGMQPWFSIPVFNWHAGLLSTIYVRRYIESAQRFPEVPRLTARQVEALDALDAVLEDPALTLFMDFEPGDVQLLHNHQILHDRSAFEDWPEPGRKRHLLRLWLCPPNGRPLPDCFAPRYGGVTVGDRGGIVVAGATPSVPLDA